MQLILIISKRGRELEFLECLEPLYQDLWFGVESPKQGL